ncbi:protein YAE1 homolog isoform X2 [Dendropsophus ebraccatus]|uniref:protein YAE1 homolog isoform X2 n=1 Tax=Dendropsophus ebraccatus TaxID=150705 RepID=UPI003831E30A
MWSFKRRAVATARDVRRLQEGFLDGMDAGKENSLQTGFNLGYKVGVSFLMPCGELRGTLSALVTWCEVHESDSSTHTKLAELLTSVTQCEDNIVKSLSSVHQISHPSDLSSALEYIDFTSCSKPSEGSCDAGQDCCVNMDSQPTLLLGCRTTQQLSNVMKQELGRILTDTISVVQQSNLSADLLSYLQMLKTKYSLF